MDEHRRNAETGELVRGRHVRPRVIQEHEIGSPCRHRLDVRRHPVAHARYGERVRRVVAPRGATHETVSRSHGEQQLGEGREERNDSTGGACEGNGAAGIVDDAERAGGGCGTVGRRTARATQERREKETAHIRTPTPGGAEMGERLRVECASATIPPARDLQVARTERSPGFGRAARLPG
jgi:hypothetical protein